MKAVKTIKNITTVLVFLLINGCASIISSDHQTMSFNSTPDNAEVYIDGRLVGRTPVTVSLKKTTTTNFEFRKEGYFPFNNHMEYGLNGWFWGNILFGGLFGSTTDSLTGAAYEYDENSYFIKLNPINLDSTTYPIKRKIKQLIVNFEHDLRLELVRGEGEYVNSLLELLEVSDSEYSDSINTLAKLSHGNPNVMVFTNTVLDFYDIK